MSAAALAALRPAHAAGQDLASGIFALPIDLASGLSLFEPSNDTGKNGVAYDEVTSESCYWTSKDPIRFDGGVNLYAYADNDPVNLVDRTGRHPEDGSDGGYPEGGPPDPEQSDDDDGEDDICDFPDCSIFTGCTPQPDCKSAARCEQLFDGCLAGGGDETCCEEGKKACNACQPQNDHYCNDNYKK